VELDAALPPEPGAVLLIELEVPVR
jgi:hypothetical protein